MSFRSGAFLLFLPAVAALYRVFPRGGRWALLLAASLWFYGSWDWRYLPLLLGVTLLSWLCGRGIAGARRGRRFFLALALAGSLGTLFLFKYADFFLGTGLSLVLPVGISFYTFQTLSYVIDIYRGEAEPERHFGLYALFVSFFPQLVAGPIERPGDLLPQLRRAETPTREDWAAGCFWLLRGFVKKVVIADRLAHAVDAVYAAPAEANGLAVLLATLLFGVQIYCDFSGYSEIALGAARLLGIRLTRNFDRPYAAASLREFWRRWHISLTRWLRDYLYLPLGGRSRAVNTLLVFLASGLWHGADWTFVLWGLYHGALLLLERRLPERKRPAATFAAVSFGWLLFRAERIGDVGLLLSRLFTGWSPAAAFRLMGLDSAALLALPLLLALLWVLDGEEPRPLTRLSAAKSALLLLAVAISWLMGLRAGAENAFLYFQF